LTRGDVVIVVMKGDYGKPRPALIVQADRYRGHSSVTIALMTSTLTEIDDIRLTIEPSAENGLQVTSQVQLDRLQSVPTSRLKDVIGRLTPTNMAAVDRGLALFLGLA
jgi:mRNA interferase MazF